MVASHATRPGPQGRQPVHETHGAGPDPGLAPVVRFTHHGEQLRSAGEGASAGLVPPSGRFGHTVQSHVKPHVFPFAEAGIPDMYKSLDVVEGAVGPSGP